MHTLLTLACTALLAAPSPEPPSTPASAPAAVTTVSPEFRQELSIAIGMNLSSAHPNVSHPIVPADRIDLDIVEQIFLQHSGSTENTEDLWDQYNGAHSSLKPILTLYRQAENKEKEATDARFMQDNASKPGVTALDNGVQYLALGKDGNSASSIETAMSVHCLTLGGNVYRIVSGELFRNESFPHSPLPACIRSQTPQLPNAQAWIFYVPRTGLTDEEASTVPDSAIYVYIVTRKDDQTARYSYSYALRPRPVHTATAETGITRNMIEQYSTFMGRTFALAYHSFYTSDRYPSAALNDLDAHTVIRTYRETSESQLAHHPDKEKQTKILQQYDRILSARQAERDRHLLQTLVEQHRIQPLGNGIFFSCRQAGDNSDVDFDEGQITKIRSLDGRLSHRFKGSPYPSSLPPCFSSLQNRLPPAREWSIYIPVSRITTEDDLQPLSGHWDSVENMQTEIGSWTSVLVYTLTVKQTAGGRDSDIEDPE